MNLNKILLLVFVFVSASNLQIAPLIPNTHQKNFVVENFEFWKFLSMNKCGGLFFNPIYKNHSIESQYQLFRIKNINEIELLTFNLLFAKRKLNISVREAIKAVINYIKSEEIYQKIVGSLRNPQKGIFQFISAYIMCSFQSSYPCLSLSCYIQLAFEDCLNQSALKNLRITAPKLRQILQVCALIKAQQIKDYYESTLIQSKTILLIFAQFQQPNLNKPLFYFLDIIQKFCSENIVQLERVFFSELILFNDKNIEMYDGFDDKLIKLKTNAKLETYYWYEYDSSFQINLKLNILTRVNCMPVKKKLIFVEEQTRPNCICYCERTQYHFCSTSFFSIIQNKNAKFFELEICSIIPKCERESYECSLVILVLAKFHNQLSTINLLNNIFLRKASDFYYINFFFQNIMINQMRTKEIKLLLKIINLHHVIWQWLTKQSITITHSHQQILLLKHNKILVSYNYSNVICRNANILKMNEKIRSNSKLNKLIYALVDLTAQFYHYCVSDYDCYIAQIAIYGKRLNLLTCAGGNICGFCKTDSDCSNANTNLYCHPQRVCSTEVSVSLDDCKKVSYDYGTVWGSVSCDLCVDNFGIEICPSKLCTSTFNICSKKCNSNFDCSFVIPFCDTNINQCFPCTNADICKNYGFNTCILSETIGSYGICVKDCHNDSECQPISSKPYCIENLCHECPSDEWCQVNKNMKICSFTKGYCSKLCISNSDCKNPSRSKCENEYCVGCISNGDCNHILSYHHCVESICKQCCSDEDCLSINPLATFCFSNFCKTINYCLANHDCTNQKSSVCSEGICQSCISDNDCLHVAKPFNKCNKAACVECLINEDCISPYKSKCNEGQCLPCENNSECFHLTTGRSELCLGRECVCTQNKECLDPNFSKCVDNQCKNCQESDDCIHLSPPQNLTCIVGVCGISCKNNNDCLNPEKSSCLDFICSSCVDDKDCFHVKGYLIKCVNGTCRSCNSNQDCLSPYSSVCEDYECTFCQLDLDCAHIRGNCIDAECVLCDKNDACAFVSKSMCIDGTCTPCVANQDCSHIFQFGKCYNGTCVECLSDEDCNLNEFTKECNGNECVSCQDIGSHQYCYNKNSSEPICFKDHCTIVCQSNDDCIYFGENKSICIENSCVECQLDSECLLDFQCINNTCIDSELTKIIESLFFEYSFVYNDDDIVFINIVENFEGIIQLILSNSDVSDVEVENIVYTINQQNKTITFQSAFNQNVLLLAQVYLYFENNLTTLIGKPKTVNDTYITIRSRSLELLVQNNSAIKASLKINNINADAGLALGVAGGSPLFINNLQDINLIQYFPINYPNTIKEYFRAANKFNLIVSKLNDSEKISSNNSSINLSQLQIFKNQFIESFYISIAFPISVCFTHVVVILAPIIVGKIQNKYLAKIFAFDESNRITLISLYYSTLTMISAGVLMQSTAKNFLYIFNFGIFTTIGMGVPIFLVFQHICLQKIKVSLISQ